MKKAIYSLLTFVCLAGVLHAQTPQAVCYQALAKDGSGNDIPDRTIAIRASILRGGPSGQIYWQETHQPMTDAFSLFTINIGEGTYQGGILTDFASFNWGDGEYWLRIEMDVNGGQNYALMGANRLLSVPYALHAATSKTATNAVNAQNAVTADTALFAQNTGNANMADTALVALSNPNDADQDPANEIQKLLFQNDSILLVDNTGTATPGSSIYFPDFSTTNEIQTLTFDDGILSLSNGGNAVNLRDDKFGGPGASSDFPQGIVGDYVLLKTGTYTVPPDKNLYVTAGGNTVKLNGFPTQVTHPTTPNMPVLPPGASITDCKCTGFLTDTTYQVQPVIIDLTSLPAYVVPNGKVLFVKSGLPNDLPGRLILDGIEIEFLRPNFTRGTRNVTIPEGTLITKPMLYSELYLTGFLINKDS